MREEKLKQMEDITSGLQAMPLPKVVPIPVDATFAAVGSNTAGTVKSLEEQLPDSTIAMHGNRGRNRHMTTSQETGSVRSIKSILKKKSASPMSSGGHDGSLNRAAGSS